jgi:hypothetical protein
MLKRCWCEVWVDRYLGNQNEPLILNFVRGLRNPKLLPNPRTELHRNDAQGRIVCSFA